METSTSSSIIPLFIADAFTVKPFAGNAAAVCLVSFDKLLPDDVQQKIAAEMNLSETAFVSTLKPGDTFEKAKRFRLRWFAPTCEIDLCGHATLASSAVLFKICNNPSDQLEFETRSGTLYASRLPDDKICIDLPAGAAQPMDSEVAKEMREAAVGELPIEEIQFAPSATKLIIRLEDHVTREELERLQPSFTKLTKIKQDGTIKGVIVTLKGNEENGCVSEKGEIYDFVSRYFAPFIGINEDPVTGSAHSVLGPYWGKILKKNKFFARQCSPRGGELRIVVRDDGRVNLSGNAMIVVKGQLCF